MSRAVAVNVLGGTLAFFACLLVFPSAGLAQDPVSATRGVPAVSAVTAESAVRRFWDAFNRAAWSELDALVQPGFQHHPPGKTMTLAEFKDGGAFVHRVFADYHLTIDELIVSGDRVAIRWTATGMHVGSFFGEPPSGRRIAVQGMHLHHVSDGRIVDDYEVIDMAGLRAALQDR